MLNEFLKSMITLNAAMAAMVSDNSDNPKRTERFIFKVPTRLTNLFRRRCRKNLLTIVPEVKKRNLFYGYAKVELEEWSPNYMDIDLEDAMFFVDYGDNSVGCFTITANSDRTEDGYVKGKVTGKILDEYLEIRNNLIKENK